MLIQGVYTHRHRQAADELGDEAIPQQVVGDDLAQ